MPKAGKSTIIDLVSTYLRRRGFDVIVHRDAAVDAPIDKDEIGALNSYLACEVVNSILSVEYNRNIYPRILILDRGIFDRCIFSDVLLELGEIDKNECETLKRFLLSDRYVSLIKRVFLFVVDKADSLARENRHALVTTKGRVMNEEFLQCFRKNAIRLHNELASVFTAINLIDTSKKDERQNETARFVARQIERDIELYSYEPKNNKTQYKLINNVLVLENFMEGKIGPYVVHYEGEEYFRYMDFLYSRKLPHEMSTNEAVEICDLRNEYLDFIVDKELNEQTVELLVEYSSQLLPYKSLNVADFGCGGGLSTKTISSLLPDATIIGFDASKAAVEHAIKNGVTAYHFSQNSAYSPYLFKGDKFNLVLAVFVMHFKIPRPDLISLRKLVKDGAVFIFNLYNLEVTEIEDDLIISGWSKPTELDSFSLPSNHRIFYCLAN